MCSRLRYSSFHSYFGFIFNESSLFQSVRNDFFLLQESTQIQSKKKKERFRAKISRRSNKRGACSIRYTY